MKVRRHLGWGLVFAALALCGCGGGSGSNPTSAESAGVAAAVARYYDALRRGDRAGVRTALAPNYDYDPGIVDPANPFDRPFGLTYASLFYNLGALTVAGHTATAIVTTTFEANVNLEFSQLGRPAVNGSSFEFLELQPRGSEWKLTAVHPVHVTYRKPGTFPPALLDFRVNGRTSLQVTPGAPLTMTGDSVNGLQVYGIIGANAATVAAGFQAPDRRAPWKLQLQAPDRPGRYLAHALLATVSTPAPSTGQFLFVSGDHVTVPVTVVAP